MADAAQVKPRLCNVFAQPLALRVSDPRLVAPKWRVSSSGLASAIQALELSAWDAQSAQSIAETNAGNLAGGYLPIDGAYVLPPVVAELLDR